MEVLSKLNSLIFLLILGLVLYHSSNSNDYIGVNAEEACSYLPDGNKVCNDEPDENHNVWTEPLGEDFSEDIENENEASSENVKNVNSNINEVELELFVVFAGQLKDWNPDDGLSKFNPEVIVLAILNAFNVFDGNDDGFLEYDEIEAVLLERQAHENLAKLKKDITRYPESKVSIFQCLMIFQKFNGGKETGTLLSPFEKLQYLPPVSAKKIIQGSVQMFIDSDENFDGKLDKDEFSVGMKQAQEKRKEMGVESVEVTSEQIDALFSVVDTDKDEYLTYIEFQNTIQEKPKTFKDSIDGVFNDADENSDGLLSEEEFMSYMKTKSKREKTNVVPTDKEVTDAFGKLDVNEDGFLSIDEMMKMFDEVKKAHEQRTTEAFNSFDKDADGFISMDELAHIVKGVEETTGQKLDVKVFMTMLDQDMDAKVSLEEMTTVLSKMIR